MTARGTTGAAGRIIRWRPAVARRGRRWGQCHPERQRGIFSNVMVAVLALMQLIQWQVTLVALSLVSLPAVAAQPQSPKPAPKRPDGVVTLIHIGDIHGHLVPRPDALGGGSVGGVARIATVI